MQQDVSNRFLCSKNESVIAIVEDISFFVNCLGYSREKKANLMPFSKGLLKPYLATIFLFRSNSKIIWKIIMGNFVEFYLGHTKIYVFAIWSQKIKNSIKLASPVWMYLNIFLEDLFQECNRTIPIDFCVLKTNPPFSLFVTFLVIVGKKG